MSDAVLVREESPYKRQRTLEETWAMPTRRDTVATSRATPDDAAVESRASSETVCVDLFCGCGGWSMGAKAAGHRVVLAIDDDPVALRVHAQNHPACAHVRMRLGAAQEDRVVALIDSHRRAGCKLHLHGSPPCQAFSAMRNLTKGRSERVGMTLVEWFIALVGRVQPDTWSFEEVSMPSVRAYLTRQQVAFDEFDFSLYGVPQTRRRILAGTPRLVAAMKQDASLRVHQRATPASALAATMPARAWYVRASGGRAPAASKTRKDDEGRWINESARWARRVQVPTWTLLCTAKPVWLSERFKTIRVFSRRELCRTQTFPDAFRIRCSEMDAVRLIGNALPPLVAKKLMRAV